MAEEKPTDGAGELHDVFNAVLVVLAAWLVFAFGPTSAHGWLGTRPTAALIHLPLGYIALSVFCVGAALFSVVRAWSPTRSYTLEQLVFLVVAYVTSLVGAFASLYVQASHDSRAACFGKAITKLDAVYFTLGTLTTAGTGRLQAKNQQCIAITTVQLILGFTVLAIVISSFVAHLQSDRPRTG